MALVWERLTTSLNSDVLRTKVPGGWLVLFCECDGMNDGGYGYGGLTFYPDLDHEWDGNSLP